MPLASGTKLGPYEIQSPLGAGGMGVVYRALDTRLDRTVALKVLPEIFFIDLKEDRTLKKFLQTPASETNAYLSPNGKWSPTSPTSPDAPRST